MKVKTVLWGFVIIVIIIAIFHDQFSWISDLFIDPSSKIDPGNIDVPGVK